MYNSPHSAFPRLFHFSARNVGLASLKVSASESWVPFSGDRSLRAAAAACFSTAESAWHRCPPSRPHAWHRSAPRSPGSPAALRIILQCPTPHLSGTCHTTRHFTARNHTKLPRATLLSPRRTSTALSPHAQRCPAQPSPLMSIIR